MCVCVCVVRVCTCVRTSLYVCVYVSVCECVCVSVYMRALPVPVSISCKQSSLCSRGHICMGWCNIAWLCTTNLFARLLLIPTHLFVPAACYVYPAHTHAQVFRAMLVDQEAGVKEITHAAKQSSLELAASAVAIGECGELGESTHTTHKHTRCIQAQGFVSNACSYRHHELLLLARHAFVANFVSLLSPQLV